MSAAGALIGEWLGVETPSSESELLRIVEERFGPTIINRLLELGLERSELDQVVIAARTLQLRRSSHEKLSLKNQTASFVSHVFFNGRSNVWQPGALAWMRRPIPRHDSNAKSRLRRCPSIGHDPMM